MMNIMEIKGYKAVIKYAPDIEMFRGKFSELNGGADFYAQNTKSLKKRAKSPSRFFCKCARKTV